MGFMGCIITGILAAAALYSSASAFLQREFRCVSFTRRQKTISGFHPSGWPLALPMKVNDESSILEIVSVLEGKPAVIVCGETIYDILPGNLPTGQNSFDQRIRVYTKKSNNMATKIQSVYSSTSSTVAEWLNRRRVQVIRTDTIDTERMYPRIDIPAKMNLLIAFAICALVMLSVGKWGFFLIDSESYLLGWFVYTVCLCILNLPILLIPQIVFQPQKYELSIIMPNYNSRVSQSDRDDHDSPYTVSNWYCTMKKVSTGTSKEVMIPSISYVLVDGDKVTSDPETSVKELIQQKHENDLVEFDNKLNTDRMT